MVRNASAPSSSFHAHSDYLLQSSSGSKRFGDTEDSWLSSIDEASLRPAMQAVKARIDDEPDKFTRFMQVYYLYNPVFPSCGDGDGAGFEGRVLAAWDAAVGTHMNGAGANSEIKRDILIAASRRVHYLISQLACQDPCVSGLSLFIPAENSPQSSMQIKRSDGTWLSDRLEAYAFLNDITGIFAMVSTLTPRPSPYDNAYPYLPYYAINIPAPVLRFAAPLAKCSFNFRMLMDSGKDEGPRAGRHFVTLESMYSGRALTGIHKLKPKGKAKVKASRLGIIPRASASDSSNVPAKDPPPAFSQEYFQDLALPDTEDTVHPHRTNLAKKAARLQELRKTMNDVS
jgi:hypothetical protein